MNSVSRVMEIEIFQNQKANAILQCSEYTTWCFMKVNVRILLDCYNLGGFRRELGYCRVQADCLRGHRARSGSSNRVAANCSHWIAKRQQILVDSERIDERVESAIDTKCLASKMDRSMYGWKAYLQNNYKLWDAPVQITQVCERDEQRIVNLYGFWPHRTQH